LPAVAWLNLLVARPRKHFGRRWSSETDLGLWSW
jgi:hypothetical protein